MVSSFRQNATTLVHKQRQTQPKMETLWYCFKCSLSLVQYLQYQDFHHILLDSDAPVLNFEIFSNQKLQRWVYAKKRWLYIATVKCLHVRSFANVIIIHIYYIYMVVDSGWLHWKWNHTSHLLWFFFLHASSVWCMCVCSAGSRSCCGRRRPSLWKRHIQLWTLSCAKETSRRWRLRSTVWR